MQHLNGDGGADTYVYSSAGGNDVIDDGGNASSLVFSDLNPADVSLSRAGAGFQLTDDGAIPPQLAVLAERDGGVGRVRQALRPRIKFAFEAFERGGAQHPSVNAFGPRVRRDGQDDSVLRECWPFAAG